MGRYMDKKSGMKSPQPKDPADLKSSNDDHVDSLKLNLIINTLPLLYTGSAAEYWKCGKIFNLEKLKTPIVEMVLPELSLQILQD